MHNLYNCLFSFWSSGEISSECVCFLTNTIGLLQIEVDGEIIFLSSIFCNSSSMICLVLGFTGYGLERIGIAFGINSMEHSKFLTAPTSVSESLKIS